jgi:hypothetical protein
MPEVPLRPGIAPKVCASGGSLTGSGDTDCTLSAEHTSAGSNCAVPVSTCSRDSDGGLIAGPMTSELVGMADGDTAIGAGTGRGSKTSRRFRAFWSRAVSGVRPNVDSISARLEQCSNGPSCTTRRGTARLEMTSPGTRKPSCR